LQFLSSVSLSLPTDAFQRVYLKILASNKSSCPGLIDGCGKCRCNEILFEMRGTF